MTQENTVLLKNNTLMQLSFRIPNGAVLVVSTIAPEAVEEYTEEHAQLILSFCKDLYDVSVYVPSDSEEKPGSDDSTANTPTTEPTIDADNSSSAANNNGTADNQPDPVPSEEAVPGVAKRPRRKTAGK